MSKKCIITFVSLEQERYVLGFKRLQQSLRKVGFDGDFLHFHNEEEIGCPKHSDVPYAFKPYAFKRAIELGYETILWCDAPVYATKDLDNIFAHIERKGYIFFDNPGFTIGDFTNDKCLKLFGMSRKESFNHPMIMACCMGLNIHSKEGMEFYTRYIAAAQNGSFVGRWNNNDYTESFDTRCRGHRHDQSAASIIISQMGLDILTGHETYFTYFNHPGMMPVADSVCLFSQGF